MKLRTFKEVTDNVFKSSLSTEDWSQADKELMARFGEPEVDLGGSFTPPVYTLPANLVRVMTESPFTETFDKRDNADAETRADTWASTIRDRINTALTTLRALSDTFTEEAVETL